MKSWGSIKKTELKPSLLSHPHIPRPLHGINPRTIMGPKKWATYRQNALIRTNHSCKACGKTGCILDLHEDYSIDYRNAVMKVTSMEPLCKDCHSFIHTGLLAVLLRDKKITQDTAKRILRRGVKIIKDNNLTLFISTAKLARSAGIDVKNIPTFTPPRSNKGWSDWYLEWEGKKYYGLSERQWKKKYNRQ